MTWLVSEIVLKCRTWAQVRSGAFGAFAISNPDPLAYSHYT